jgi:hypothetical protein
MDGYSITEVCTYREEEFGIQTNIFEECTNGGGGWYIAQYIIGVYMSMEEEYGIQCTILKECVYGERGWYTAHYIIGVCIWMRRMVYSPLYYRSVYMEEVDGIQPTIL